MADARWNNALGLARIAAGLVLLVPVGAACVGPDFAPVFSCLLAGLFALTLARPVLGVAAISLLLPLSLAYEIRFGPHPPTAQAAEAMLVTFAAAGLMRSARAGADMRTWLGAPATVLAAAVVTSMLVQLSVLQAISPTRALLRESWLHLTRDYWRTPDFLFLHDGWRWLAGLAAAVMTERIVRTHDRHRRLLLRVWLAAGALSSLYGAARLVQLLSRLDMPVWQGLVWVLTNLRVSALHPDFNAAGSFFVLFLAPAIVFAVACRERWVWVGVIPVVMVAFGLAQSRAAILGLLLALALLGLTLTRRPRAALLVVGVTAAALLAAAMLTAPSHATISSAMELRVEMIQVGGRIVSRYPLFGVGLDGYIRAARRFTSPDQTALLRFAPTGENAHNNFLQIAGELGLPALLAFLWLVLPAACFLWPGRRDTPVRVPTVGMGAGIAAFLITALGGHPLLIPQVAFAFSLALGLTCGFGTAPSFKPDWTRYAIGGGVFFYAASLLFRLR